MSLIVSNLEEGFNNLPKFSIPQEYTIDSWDKLLVDQYWSFYEIFIRYIMNNDKLNKNENALKIGLKAIEKKITGEIRPKNDLSFEFYYFEVMLSSMEKITTDIKTRNEIGCNMLWISNHMLKYINNTFNYYQTVTAIQDYYKNSCKNPQPLFESIRNMDVTIP